METLKFKTNIHCGDCIAKVTPFLNEEEGIKDWKVDTADPQKVLTVETDQLAPEEVVKVISQAGYKAEPLK